MTKDQITKALRSMGASMAGIGRELKMSRSAVYLAVSGKTYSPLIQGYIARHTGYTLETMWPHLYGKNSQLPKNGRPMSKGFVK